jgi:hypothetical protein
VPPAAATPTTREVLSTAQRDYDRLKAKLKRIDIFEVQPCFMNCDLACRSSCFLILCDLAVLAKSSSRLQLLPGTGCKGGLSHILTSLGVAPDTSILHHYFVS